NQGQVCVKVIQRAKDSHQECKSWIEFSVTDTGIGIDINKCECLFEPFVQADSSIKRRYGGTGLGLAICKRLVELMGGQICLESHGIGQGTTVRIELPDKTSNETTIK
ncbi:MAG TPA: ATP-binding protein, partial [Cyanophyceae cyanobacterium]